MANFDYIKPFLMMGVLITPLTVIRDGSIANAVQPDHETLSQAKLSVFDRSWLNPIVPIQVDAAYALPPVAKRANQAARALGLPAYCVPTSKCPNDERPDRSRALGVFLAIFALPIRLLARAHRCHTRAKGLEMMPNR